MSLKLKFQMIQKNKIIFPSVFQADKHKETSQGSCHSSQILLIISLLQQMYF